MSLKYSQAELAKEVLDEICHTLPNFSHIFVRKGIHTTLTETEQHIKNLFQAIHLGQSAIFTEYVQQTKDAMKNKKLSQTIFKVTLECMDVVLKQRLYPEMYQIATQYIFDALKILFSQDQPKKVCLLE